MLKILILSIVCLLSTTSVLYAGPALDDILDIQQPDGTFFKARLQGDEFQNWTETESGHTVIRNTQTREWEYAVQHQDGTLHESGHKVVQGRSAPTGIPKRLKPPRNSDLELDINKMLNETYQQRLLESVTVPPSGASAAPGDYVPVPVSGAKNVLIVLINFANRTLQTTAANWYTSVFDESSKSVAKFYKDNSYGKLSISPVAHTQPGNPAGVVSVTIADNHPNYGSNYVYATETAILSHALAEAAPYVNFASFDTNGNGVLEQSELTIYFIYAGYEASGSALTPNIWAHAWSGSITAGTKTITRWAQNGELNNSSVQHPMGVISHELGHSLGGLPDLYDISNQNQGLGNFSLMAGGSWGADIGEYSGTTPTNLDAWCREYLGWTTPVTPVSATTLSLVHPLSSQTAAYKIIAPLNSTTEYFLVENRQPVGWDLGLRGKTGFGSGWAGGLLIMHIDITAGTVGSNDINSYTANSGRQGVIPVQASTAACNMLSVGASCRGNATTLYYTGNNTSWGPLTTPNSNYYSGMVTNFSLTGISSPAATMTGNLSLTPPVVIQLPVAIDNDAWTVTTGGNGNWSGQSTTSHDGVDAAQSATITDSQSTWMQTTVTGAGTLSFWWKVSSESGFDKLNYYVDGVLQGSGISGESGWMQVTGIPISAGSHTIKWEYSKDGSISAGSDAGWVDQVVFTPLYPLTFTFAGTGSGSVNSNPSGIACTGTSGSACAPYSYTSGTSVTLTPTASVGSYFGGWSVDCAAFGTGNCTLSMTAAHNATASFVMNDYVRIGSAATPYGTLNLAYTAANSGDIIKAQGITFSENLTLNSGYSISMLCGYVPGFGSRSGYTTLNGILTIGTGCMTVDQLVVR